MTSNQRLPASLTPLDAALAALLAGIEPVAPIELPLAEALGCIAAEMPVLEALPARDTAIADGWALRAQDLVGASSYSPVPLAAAPTWVEAGDSIPQGCDCVLDADLVDTAGPFAQVLAEAIPGQGVRRAGEDNSRGEPSIAPGARVRPLDLLVARAAGLQSLRLRRPRLRLVNSPGGAVTASLIAESARAEGAEVTRTDAASRDAGAIATLLDPFACDVLVTVGGSGIGRGDATIAAVRERGEIFVHGVALQPGRTAAVGRIGRVPVVALLARTQATWLQLAVGDLPLAAVARADAWLVIPASSEGFAAEAAVGAYMLRE